MSILIHIVNNALLLVEDKKPPIGHDADICCRLLAQCVVEGAIFNDLLSNPSFELLLPVLNGARHIDN